MPQQPSTVSRAAVPANGETRPKLHLGFGNGQTHNGAAMEAPGANEQTRPMQAQRPPVPSQHSMVERTPQRTFDARPIDRPDYGLSEGRPSAQAPRGDADGERRTNGNFLDHELRARVDGDIAAFLAAFDAVLAADTQESRFGLREATDRLLRAGARTRIELERLEARVPLTPREGGGRGEPGWRYHR
jgi:hypothetical protein